MLKRLRLPQFLRRKKKLIDPETLEMRSLTNLEKLFGQMNNPRRESVRELEPVAESIRACIANEAFATPSDAFQKLASCADKEYDAFDKDLYDYVSKVDDAVVDEADASAPSSSPPSTPLPAAAIEEVDKMPSSSSSLPSSSSAEGMDALSTFLSSEEEADRLRPRALAGLRLLMFKKYCLAMESAAREGVVELVVPRRIALLNTVVDANLLGTAPERHVEHMRLFEGGTMTQEGVQSCLYLTLEPEVEAATELLREQPQITKKVRKALDKYSKTYLLDIAEVNVKSRCIFNWSHPAYAGLKPVEEDSVLGVDVLAKGRQEFFPESNDVAAMFHKDYVGVRKLFWEKKRDNRSTLKKGAWFFMGTMVLDLIVQTW